MSVLTIPGRRATPRPYVSRHTRRRPWWLGALDRELYAVGQYVGHRSRIAIAAYAIFGMIYFGDSDGGVS